MTMTEHRSALSEELGASGQATDTHEAVAGMYSQLGAQRAGHPWSRLNGEVRMPGDTDTRHGASLFACLTVDYGRTV